MNEEALFSGDGYSDRAVASQYGRYGYRADPLEELAQEAYEALTAPKNAKLMVQLGIFNERELAARQSVLQEAYASEL